MAPVRAEDRVTVRGAYYREASTRVIQPVVEISKDLPSGFDITAHYLLDAITSASVAAGTPSDTIFTELRNEVGLAVGRTWDRWRTTLGYSYSAESDYWSHGARARRPTASGATARRVAASGGISLDGAWPRTRTPNCPTAATSSSASCASTSGRSRIRRSGARRFVTQIGVEGSYLDGYQASLYRAVPNLGFENVQSKRLRDV